VSTRLKLILPNILVELKDAEKRKEMETIISGIIDYISQFDAVIETFIVDQVSKISSNIAKDPDGVADQLSKLLEFATLLASANIHAVTDLPIAAPLRQYFDDFLTGDAAAPGMACLVTNGPAKANCEELDFADPHVYLKEIQILDDTCLAGGDASIASLLDKFLAVIHLSLPLLDVAKAADKLPRPAPKAGKMPVTHCAEIEGILDLLTGNQARVYTRRIVTLTKQFSDLQGKIQDIEHERELLAEKHDKPWMFMLSESELISDAEFQDRAGTLDAHIASYKESLATEIASFQGSAASNELVDALEKLNHHMDFNIVNSLNEAILRIRATGTRGLILPRADLDLVTKAGIKIDNILVTTDSPFPDLDALNQNYFETKERLLNLITKITNTLAKRALEEQPIVETGIIAALLSIMKDYEVNLKTNTSCGRLCMTTLVQDAEIDLMEKLDREIGHLSLLTSSSFVDPVQLQSIADALGVPDLGAIDLDVLETTVKTSTFPSSLSDAGTRLLRYTPLSREAYFAPEITAARDRMAGIAANLKMLDAIFALLVDIGRNLEELDIYLPRQFIAMDDARMPMTFAATLDAWLNENMGRLIATGGMTFQQEAAAKIESIKVKLENLQDLELTIPDDVFEKVKPVPLPIAA
jgi:hypothetical protein